MIDATTEEAQPQPARKGFWSLRSDDESVERGQLNFWAMLETLLAIAGFWWIALKYETFFLLYSSLFVAPLLFLRSEESVRQGVEWRDRGMFAAAAAARTRSAQGGGATLGAPLAVDRRGDRPLRRNGGRLSGG